MCLLVCAFIHMSEKQSTEGIYDTELRSVKQFYQNLELNSEIDTLVQPFINCVTVGKWLTPTCNSDFHY